MRRLWITITITLPLSFTCPAQAQTEKEVQARYSKEYDDCLSNGDAAQGTTSALIECIGDESDRQNARLNQAYRMVMARLSSPQKARLRNSERVWIGQRDAECNRATAGGGSIAGVNYSSCMLFETTKRTIWLERYRP